jgi:probable rRNA maturation factor
LIKNRSIKKKRTKSKIFLKNFHPSIKTPVNKAEVLKIAKKVMDGEDCASYYLEINLIENAEIKRINKKFLNHNYFTDIITFPYSAIKSEIEGEIFISLDEVKKNSAFYGNSYKNEFLRVVVHGCLHLAGFDDRTKSQKELIRKKENFYLSNFGKGN